MTANDEDRTPLQDALVYSIIGGADEELFGVGDIAGDTAGAHRGNAERPPLPIARPVRRDADGSSR